MEEKILATIKRAPMTSKDISKLIQKDTTIAGAYLSDLSSRKKVLVTHLRNGSSPFYYLPENKSQLIGLSRYIDPKDIETYNLISDRKILREKELQLLPRLSLRNLKDFAIQLNIVVDGIKEIFWKWFMLSDEETESMINNILNSQESKRKELIEQKLAEQEEIRKAEENRINELRKAEEIKRVEEFKKVEELRKIEELRKAEELKRTEENRRIEELRKAEEKLRVSEESKKKELDNLEKMNKMIQDKFDMMQKQFDLKYKELEKHKKEIEESFKKKEEEYLNKFEELKKSINVPVVQEPDEFLEFVNDYCNKNNFSVIDTNVVKKNKEIDMTIMFNGTKYFFKAKNKKKCNETDIIGAYVIGNERNMPVMFMSGELTKKASEMLNNELNNKVFYRKLD